MTQTAYTPPAAEIFKAYDIRGIVDHTLTTETTCAIGHALGSEALARQQQAIVVGRDGRLSGPALSAALTKGIRAAGVNVIDIGCVPTPLSYFAACYLGTDSCVSVTGSHNPPDYNGLKIVLDGQTLYGPLIQDLRRRILEQDFRHGKGKFKQEEIIQAYLQRVCGDIRLSRMLKIVIDCGNGIAGVVAPALFKRLGCDIVELFCDVDGHFPNHHPDPSRPENLTDLIQAVRKHDADIGLAFDGDGDRLGVVTKDGQIIYPDRQLMLFAEDVLTRVPGGEILYDVKCSRNLANWIRTRGGIPTMWSTGHALIKNQLKKSGAPLAGEMSGHVFFKERWYGFDDGLYAAARLLEILSKHPDPSALLNALPDTICTPELNIKMNEGEPFELVRRLKEQANFSDATQIITIDGIRVEYADGFGLARPSNTTPVVVLRFEGDNPLALQRIQHTFGQALQQAWPGIALPY